MKDDGSKAEQIMSDVDASPTGWNKLNLIIQQNILVPDYNYSVVLKVRYESGQAQSYNVRKLTTSSVPDGGYCALSG